jgi:hypothetical protein
MKRLISPLLIFLLCSCERNEHFISPAKMPPVILFTQIDGNCPILPSTLKYNYCLIPFDKIVYIIPIIMANTIECIPTYNPHNLTSIKEMLIPSKRE